MSCGHFKRIIFDDSKLHRCEFCGGAAHFEIKPDGNFMIGCESCSYHLEEVEVLDDKTIDERIEHIAKVWNRGYFLGGRTDGNKQKEDERGSGQQTAEMGAAPECGA